MFVSIGASSLLAQSQRVPGSRLSGIKQAHSLQQPATTDLAISGSIGGGVASPPSNAFGQGIAVVGTLVVETPNIPLPLLLDLSSSSYSSKEDAVNADLTAVSVGLRLGLSGTQSDPRVWMLGAVSYARGIATDYSTSSQLVSPWGGGGTFGIGMRISNSFSAEIRAHSTQGTTWIPLVLAYRIR
jgi:hypothetical protein